MHVFASLILTALVCIVLGRIPELFTVLAPLQLGKVAVAAGLAVVLAVNPARLTALLKDTPMGRCLLVILALSFAGIPFSVFKSGALEEFIGLCRMLLVISVMAGLAAGGREHVLRNACVWILLLMTALMLMDKGTGRIMISSTYDPNDLALLFVVFLPIVANEAMCGGRATRLAALTATVCAVMAVPLTGSRGGIIALAAIGLHALALIKKRRPVLVLILALGVFIVGVTADETLWERFQALHDQTDYNLDGRTGRLTIWKEGLRLMAAHPLLGVGVGQFPTALGMLGNGTWKAAHNIFIQIGSELGLIGLAAFCAILVSIFRLAKRGASAPFLPPADRQRYAALRISLTGYCVGGFFLSQAYGFIFFTFLALAAVMHIRLAQAEHAARASRGPDGILAPATGASRIRRDAVPLAFDFPARTALATRKRREARLRRGDMVHAQSKEGGP